MKRRFDCTGALASGAHRARCEWCRAEWARSRGLVRVVDYINDGVLIPRGVIRAGGLSDPYVEEWVLLILSRAIVSAHRTKLAALRYYQRRPRARRALQAAAALAPNKLEMARVVTEYVSQFAAEAAAPPRETLATYHAFWFVE